MNEDKYVTVKVKLSVARGLKGYQPPCPGSDEVWMYTYPNGDTRNCIAVPLPYADNGSCMIALSGVSDSTSWGCGRTTRIKKTLPYPEVICIVDAGEGLLKLGEKMERMAGDWIKVGKMESYLHL